MQRSAQSKSWLNSVKSLIAVAFILSVAVVVVGQFTPNAFLWLAPWLSPKVDDVDSSYAGISAYGSCSSGLDCPLIPLTAPPAPSPGVAEALEDEDTCLDTTAGNTPSFDTGTCIDDDGSDSECAAYTTGIYFCEPDTTTNIGMCALGASYADCDIVDVCFDGTNYRTGCTYCGKAVADNDACDQNVAFPSSATIYSPDGMCVEQGATDFCDPGEVCDSGGVLYPDCDTAECPDGAQCDSDGGTSYSADGVCTDGIVGTCLTNGNMVAKSGSDYYAACAAGRECDSSLASQTYTRDGYCGGGSCCTSDLASGETSGTVDWGGGDEACGCTGNAAEICDNTPATGPSAEGSCVGAACCTTWVASGETSSPDWDGGDESCGCSGHAGEICDSDPEDGLEDDGICAASGDDCTPFVGGDGSSGNPYQIDSDLGLQAMNDFLSSSFVLVNDIDASDTQNWNPGSDPQGFDPIGNSTHPFTGTFDGGAPAIITDLFIDRPTEDYVGLFGYVEGATITNVHLTGVDITGDDYVGGLAGYLSVSSSTIVNCSVEGVVSGTNAVGGLVGDQSDSGVIANSSASVNASGTDYVGGLVGALNSGSIVSSYATGDVTGTGNYAGGLVGDEHGDIDDSYAIGDVSGNVQVGGLVGSNYETITNSFSAGSVSGSSDVGGLVGTDVSAGVMVNSYYNYHAGNPEACVGNIGGSLTGCTPKCFADYFYDTSNEPMASWGSAWGTDCDDTGYPVLGWETSPTCRTSGGANCWAGSGTGGSPYQITDCVTLQLMGDSLSSYYILNDNIDCSDTSNWNGGAGFVPIGTGGDPFDGNFNGNDKTISDLFINRPSTVDVGLFGYADSATISDVGLIDVDVTGYTGVGGLVGQDWSGVITGSYVTGSVSGSDTFSHGHAGGLEGDNYYGTIDDSYSTADVDGNEYIGGLVGNANFVTITNCYATGNVNASGQYAGGLLGFVDAGTALDYSFATGSVSGSTSVGGLVGLASGTITGSYYNNHSGNPDDCVGYDDGLIECTAIADNLAYFKGDMEPFPPTSSWNFATVWEERARDFPSLQWQGVGTNITYLPCDGLDDYDACDSDKDTVDDGYCNDTASTGVCLPYVCPDKMTGQGTSGDECRITNCTQLQNMSLDLTLDYILTDNIDCSDTSNWNSGAGFDPIAGLAGSLNGNDYTISDLYINLPSTGHVGLFGNMLSDGTVDDLGLVDVNITGAGYVGGLVGYNQGTVTGSSASGSVTGAGWVGGLIGINWYNTITDSSSSASVSSTGLYVGGLVGDNRGDITGSSASGSVTGASWVGGLVGYNRDGTVTNSYASADVTCSSNWVGGLIGYLSSSVTDSYATGSVTGTYTNGMYVGGLVGLISYSGVVTDSYATGSVSSTGNYVGGLVGNNLNTVDDSYATGNVDGDRRVGGLIGYNTDAFVDNSFSTGDVSGSTIVGGLVGYHDDGSTITNSYYNNQSGNPTVCVGGDAGTTECTAVSNFPDYFKDDVYPVFEPMASWDFDSIWDELDNGFPVLVWQGAGGTESYVGHTCNSTNGVLYKGECNSRCDYGKTCDSDAGDAYDSNGFCADDDTCCTADYIPMYHKCGGSAATSGQAGDADADGIWDSVVAWSGSEWVLDFDEVFWNGTAHITDADTGGYTTEGYECDAGLVMDDGYTQEGKTAGGFCVTSGHIVCPEGANALCYGACGVSRSDQNCDYNLTTGESFTVTGSCLKNTTNDWLCGNTPSFVTPSPNITNFITPTYNSPFTVQCNATLEDGDGYQNITVVNATLWNPTTSSETALDDTDKHYTDTCCTLSNGAGNTVDASCGFNVQWYAEPSEWTCKIRAYDSTGLTDNASRDDLSIDSIQGLAYSAGANEITFGEVAAGNTTPLPGQTPLDVENTGTLEIDVELPSAEDFECDIGYILLSNLHYNTTNQLYGNMCAAGSACAATEENFNLRKRNSEDGSNPSKSTYWKLVIPSGGVKGTCNTTIQYNVVGGQI